MSGTAMTRRAVIGSSAALATVGCESSGGLSPGKAPPPAPTGQADDAHAHFFNAADLPVAEFIRFTRLRAAGTLALPLMALVDILVRVVLPASTTAQAEMDELDAANTPVDISPAEFGRRVVQREFTLANQAAAAGGVPSYEGEPSPAVLRSAYKALRRELARGGGVAASAVGDDPYASAASAALGENRAAAASTRGPLSLGDLEAKVGWAYLMLLRRRRHLERYLAAFATAGLPPLVVNLLVDYDLWLGRTHATPGSDGPDQIAFWAKFRASPAGKAADIRTFGAYCPLRHVVDALKTPGNTRADALLGQLRDGIIAGLKLYPPMGFLPIGNAGRDNSFFHGTGGGVGDRPLDAFRAAGGTGRLGDALDARLWQVYAAAAAGGYPILAHAGTGNAAAKNFEDRARPGGWLPVAARHPDLRLCLGHFTFQYDQFIRAVAADPPTGPTPTGPLFDIWPYSGTQTMIADRGGIASNVFVDISYSDIALQGDARAIAYFAALHRYLSKYDPDFSQVLYGTDWIMLGIEGGAAGYYPAVARTLIAAGWTDEQRDRLFHRNLRRFLGDVQAKP